MTLENVKNAKTEFNNEFLELESILNNTKINDSYKDTIKIINNYRDFFEKKNYSIGVKTCDGQLREVKQLYDEAILTNKDKNINKKKIVYERILKKMKNQKIALNNIENYYSDESCECNREQYLNRDEGRVVCTGCGFVHEEKYPVHQNRRVYDEKQKERVINEPCNGLGSRMNGKWDYSGKLLPVGTRKTYGMLKKINTGSRLDSKRSLFGEGKTNLDIICSSLDIPKRISNEAMYLLEKLWFFNLINGRGYSIASPACVYAACKNNNSIIRLKEIEEFSGEKAGKIFKYYYKNIFPLIKKEETHYEEDIKKQVEEEIESQVRLQINTLVKELGLSNDFSKKCMNYYKLRNKSSHLPTIIGTAAGLIKNVAKTNNTHINPRTVYENMKKKIPPHLRDKDESRLTQKIISELTGLTIITVRKYAFKLAV